ncbi:MAG TPA: hypothetical protein VMZ26_12965, partial [Pyrinomonadaceae bacterium]|nr:hypothetical protein [Pyrinomonadaceae bacterium]
MRSGSASPKKKLHTITPAIPLQAYFNKFYKRAVADHKLGLQPADDSTAKLHVPISIIAHAETGTSHLTAGT